MRPSTLVGVTNPLDTAKVYVSSHARTASAQRHSSRGEREQITPEDADGMNFV